LIEVETFGTPAACPPGFFFAAFFLCDGLRPPAPPLRRTDVIASPEWRSDIMRLPAVENFLINFRYANKAEFRLN
jgi:hypothetical protein